MKGDSPVNRMLDGLEWMPLPVVGPATDGVLFATHEGLLRVGDHELRVYQLNDGRRVFSQEDVMAFFSDGSDGLT